MLVNKRIICERDDEVDDAEVAVGDTEVAVGDAEGAVDDAASQEEEGEEEVVYLSIEAAEVLGNLLTRISDGGYDLLSPEEYEILYSSLDGTVADLSNFGDYSQDLRKLTIF